MIYIARIDQGVVASVTVQPDDYRPTDSEAVVGPENVVGIGWLWDGEAFTAPEPQPDAPNTNSAT